MKAKYANDQEKLNKKTMEFYKQEHISPFGGCVGGCLPMLIQWPIFIAFYGAIRSISEMEIYRIYETIKTTGVANISRWLWVQNLWQPDTFQATVLPAYSAVSKFAVFSGVTEEAYNQVMAPLMNQYSGLVNGTYILPVLAAGASFFQGWLAANLAKTPEQRAKAKENKAAGKRDETETTNKIMQYMFPAMSFFFCMTSSAAFALYWLASNVASICSTIIIDRVFLRNMGKGDNKPKEDKGGIF
jgi:YidC/Oxa1 family membrane protein insertase